MRYNWKSAQGEGDSRQPTSLLARQLANCIKDGTIDLMLHKNVNLELTVKSVRPETPGYFSVVFERPRNFMYQAGDWMDIDFAGRNLQGGKTYSFASSPTEPDLVITMRQGVSQVKQALASIQPGDKLLAIQYGNAYDFRLRESKSSALIAGGVGIAPFRGMLKETAGEQDNSSVHLLYFNQTTDFLFKHELDKWQQSSPFLSITYAATKDLDRKGRERLVLGMATEPRQYYYVAGPPAMVCSTIAVLKDAGIDKRYILMDSFDGY